MPVHETLRLGVIDAVDNLHNVDISGQRLSGRTTLLNQIASNLRARDRDLLVVTASPMLQEVPLGALGLCGLVSSTPFDIAQEIAKKLRSAGAVIAVDGWDLLDRESWAALVHVHQSASIPLIVTRDINRGAPGPFALPGIAFARTFEMPELDVASLSKMVSAKFSLELDAPTVAQLAALSCGSPGVACAVIASALDEEVLVDDEGRGRLVRGSLWTRGAAAVAEMMLASLDRRLRDGVERLSALGPVPLQHGVDVLGSRMIAELSDLELIRLADGADQVHITVRSPLIDEFFLRHPNRVRHALLASGDGSGRGAVMPAAPASTMALLTDAYSRAHRAEIAARRAWEAEPGLGTAAELIETLAGSAAPHDSIRELFLRSAELDGIVDDKLRWGLLYLRHGLYCLGDASLALAHLARFERSHPELSGCVRAAEVFAAVMTGEEPDLDALPRTFDKLWEGTERIVTWARLHAATFGGRLEEARTLLAAVDGPNPFTSYVDTFTIACMLRIADGDYGPFTTEVEQRFAQAKKSRQWRGLATLTYLSGLSVGFYGDRTLAQSHLRELLDLGAPVPNELVKQGIASGWVAAFRDADTPVPAEFTPDHTHALFSPYPGSHPQWQQALELEAAGATTAAADVATALADEQWARGHRLAAAFGYQFAATVDPAPARMAPLDSRVRSLDARGFNEISRWLRLLCRGDVAGAEQALHDIEETTSHPATAAVWASIARQWSKRGEDARAFAANRRASRGGGRDAAELTWSKREHEVVIYVSMGRTNKQIANALQLSVRTVESHVARAIKRVGVANRAELRELVLAAS